MKEHIIRHLDREVERHTDVLARATLQEQELTQGGRDNRMHSATLYVRLLVSVVGHGQLLSDAFLPRAQKYGSGGASGLKK